MVTETDVRYFLLEIKSNQIKSNQLLNQTYLGNGGKCFTDEQKFVIS